ncbi:polyphosphate polymerase domain-containing protein [Faecalicatena sp. AGMB00832]|uniref:Polyphosphate polymerase domain-containing protein n=1 Tax=Faecalicatena faecalis TaxID=2726362 RepID=A0ABS6D664_9FIRM|nr:MULTISPECIES: polyphosphate polymerase domain-containing protein [Faecalicatena]MBU3876672.1 polyphosphate polymerase domain-containing protein [Faecalicatena faecalis]MCI6467427.1 polyphosphate polymerase domain-containing protein [Faecalicatena sp.]MDY5618125.1 polyphosphate polymerase domain-containing protein [Lachnospiraceae bacterium]
MKEVLRQEKKYLLSLEQYRRLDNTFEKVLRPDEHNGTRGYLIRSLYFDTMQERDFYEKEDGLEIRRKIRLRTYSPDSDYAMLEMKQKQGENQKKRSLRVKREDAMELTQGHYSCLLNYEEPFAKECYGLLNIHCYRPKSIVEYRRKAYVASENKTRITFDSDIRATESDFCIFSPSLNLNPVFDPYLTVMEVKYNGFLLSYIKQMVSMDGKIPTSVSKYSFSRSVGLHYLF